MIYLLAFRQTNIPPAVPVWITLT